jgi:hypothetical protein
MFIPTAHRSKAEILMAQGATAMQRKCCNAARICRKHYQAVNAKNGIEELYMAEVA